MSFNSRILIPRHFTRDDMQLVLDKLPKKSFQKGDKIKVHNRMEHDGMYILEASPGKGFHPEFDPYYTPKQMLKMGVFEGKYLNDCLTEFPKDWYVTSSGNLLETFSPEHPEPTVNYFGIKSRLSLKEWKRNKWVPCTMTRAGQRICNILQLDPRSIEDPDASRGWFLWYCRYWLGRRVPIIDDIQIERWKNFKRHAAQVQKHCKGKMSCREKQRQALLQWAWNAEA